MMADTINMQQDQQLNRTDTLGIDCMQCVQSNNNIALPCTLAIDIATA